MLRQTTRHARNRNLLQNLLLLILVALLAACGSSGASGSSLAPRTGAAKSSMKAGGESDDNRSRSQVHKGPEAAAVPAE